MGRTITTGIICTINGTASLCVVVDSQNWARCFRYKFDGKSFNKDYMKNFDLNSSEYKEFVA